MIPDTETVRRQVKAKLAEQGWTLTRVVKKMNERHPDKKETTVQNISNKLKRGTIKYSEILEIADIIGMEVLWAENDRANTDVPKMWFV